MQKNKLHDVTHDMAASNCLECVISPPGPLVSTEYDELCDPMEDTDDIDEMDDWELNDIAESKRRKRKRRTVPCLHSHVMSDTQSFALTYYTPYAIRFVCVCVCVCVCWLNFL